MINENVILAITGLIGAIIGYYFKIRQTEVSRDIGERDLLMRIDKLQTQVFEMARENAALRAEVEALRDEIHKLTQKTTKRGTKNAKQ